MKDGFKDLNEGNFNYNMPKEKLNEKKKKEEDDTEETKSEEEHQSVVNLLIQGLTAMDILKK